MYPQRAAGVTGNGLLPACPWFIRMAASLRKCASLACGTSWSIGLNDCFTLPLIDRQSITVTITEKHTDFAELISLQSHLQLAIDDSLTTTVYFQFAYLVWLLVWELVSTFIVITLFASFFQMWFECMPKLVTIENIFMHNYKNLHIYYCVVLIGFFLNYKT